ncbi:hypothetical protein [Porphyromonas pogonae]|nr:hypothetical protein [Porphyromonas pogonae]
MTKRESRKQRSNWPAMQRSLEVNVDHLTCIKKERGAAIVRTAAPLSVL